jgi:hypothetical protein
MRIEMTDSTLKQIGFSIWSEQLTRAIRERGPKRLRFNRLRHIEWIVEKTLFYDRNNAIFQIVKTENEAMARMREMQFCVLNIDAKTEKQFTDWLSQCDLDIEQALLEILGTGLKISCSWIDDSDAFCFTMVGTDRTKDHQGKCLSTWSDDLAEVTYMAYFKHFVLCNGGPWPQNERGARWG